MPIYEETTGANPDDIYNLSTPSFYSTWGFSWGRSWGLSWDSFPIPFYSSTTNAPGNPFEENSGAGSTLFASTTGTNPDPIYEEN
jgi:hypothetical protein